MSITALPQYYRCIGHLCVLITEQPQPFAQGTYHHDDITPAHMESAYRYSLAHNQLVIVSTPKRWGGIDGRTADYADMVYVPHRGGYRCIKDRFGLVEPIPLDKRRSV